jgi:hypothetical protein
MNVAEHPIVEFTERSYFLDDDYAGESSIETDPPVHHAEQISTTTPI